MDESSGVATRGFAEWSDLSTVGTGANEFQRGCPTCVHSEAPKDEDSTWWIRCKKGRQPDGENVFNACSEWAVHPCFTMGM